jgi:hypothetical protein
VPTSDPNILTFKQLEDLWTGAGGDARLAPTMASIAEAESGGTPRRTGEINNNPSTGDYSVGPWQINYYGSLLGPRSARYGPPSLLASDPAADAAAAVDLAKGGSGLGNWTTWKDGAFFGYAHKYAPGEKILVPVAGGGSMWLGSGQPGPSGGVGQGTNAVGKTLVAATDSLFKDPFAVLKFIFSYRFLEILGGGALILLGLYLLGKQFGATLPAPPQAKAVAAAAEAA